MPRFEKIQFKNFEEGESGKSFSTTPKIQYSNKIQLNSNDNIELGKNLNSVSIANTIMGEQIEMAGNYNDSDVVYFLQTTIIATIEHVCLYKMSIGGAPTLVKDFGAGTAEYLIMHKNIMIAHYNDDTLGKDVFMRSTTPTVSGSWSAIATLDSKALLGFAILGDKFSFLIDVGKNTSLISGLYESIDEGLTFNLIAEVPALDVIAFKNFLYFRSNMFYRWENDEAIIVQKRFFATVFEFNGELYAQDYKTRNLYKFNEDKFDLLKKFENYRPYYIGKGANKAYFQIETAGTGITLTYTYISMNEQEAIFKEFIYENKDEDDWKPQIIIGDSQTTYLIVQDLNTTQMLIYNDYVKNYISAGDITTTLVDKGEMVPKQLILRHAPLITGTSVKVYIKKNMASSWGSAIITSNTVGAVKAKFNFPTGAIYDFVEFKIELITTDSTKTPTDIQLDLLYLPIGLENAK